MNKQNNNRVVIGFCAHGQFSGTHLNYPPVIDEVELEAILTDVAEAFPTAKRIIRVPRKEVPRYSALLRKISVVCFLLLFAIGINAQSARLNLRLENNPLSFVQMVIEPDGILMVDSINDISIYYAIIDGQYGDPVLVTKSEFNEIIKFYFLMEAYSVYAFDPQTQARIRFRIVE